MRIYIVGAHSVGKTTLARYISKKFNLELISEVARKVLIEKELAIDSLRVDMDVVDNYQKQVFFRQINEELNKDDFCCDRGFDNIAYAIQHSRVASFLW